MGKVGRNDLCPCGSGKKYKKCCLLRADKLDTTTDTDPMMRVEPNRSIPDDVEAGIPHDLIRLETLSNDIIDFIEEGRFDDALLNCRVLMDDYPDQIDGIMRYAEVYEAMGNIEKAIEYHELTAKQMKTDGGFEEESWQWHEDAVKRLKIQLTGGV